MPDEDRNDQPNEEQNNDPNAIVHLKVCPFASQPDKRVLFISDNGHHQLKTDLYFLCKIGCFYTGRGSGLQDQA